MDHIKELRNRGTIVALILLVGSCLAYSFNKQILAIIRAPLTEGQELISLNVGGSFAVIMNISIMSGFVIATPFLIYHLYAFLRPMMPQKVRQNAAIMFFSSLGLLAGGIAFAYYLALPAALNFLLQFSDGAIIMSQLSVDTYLGFFIKYLLGLALIFQTPLVLMIVHWVHPLTPGGLMKSERWVLVISFIIAALITPTSDPINLMMVALPTIAVYQLGVAVIIIGIYRERRRAKKTALRTQKRELAAVKHAVAERKKLNVGPSRPSAVLAVSAPAIAPAQPVVAQVAPQQPKRAVLTAKPTVSKPVPVDPFLAQPRVQAPQLSVVQRAASQSVSRPAERSAQTYRNRKSIDGFARRPVAPVTPQPVIQSVTAHPMQNMVNRQPASSYSRLSVDGISSALAS
jgi:sec-independent protein translocase protein TatC